MRALAAALPAGRGTVATVATLSPAQLPPGRDHLDEVDRERVERLERLVDAGQVEAAQDLAEELWAEACDAHRELYRGLANALTAACAADRGQSRGARQIAAATRAILAPFPRRSLGFDLDLLLASLDQLVATGDGRVVLRQSP